MTRFSGGSIPRRAAAALAFLVATGCHTSPAPSVVARTDTQRGAMVVLHMVDGSEHSGELLAVRESTLVLLASGRVAVAPVSSVGSIDFGEERVAVQGTSPAEVLERARGASRFPFGIPPAAMTVLLQHAGQTAPLELRSGTP